DPRAAAPDQLRNAAHPAAVDRRGRRRRDDLRRHPPAQVAGRGLNPPRPQPNREDLPMTLFRTAALCACLALPLVAAPAAQATPSDIGDEIRSELVDARKEIRVEMAKAREELRTENLRLDNSLRFGR